MDGRMGVDLMDSNEQHRTLVTGLLGGDDRLKQLFHDSPEFRAAITMMASMAPHLVTAAVAEAERATRERALPPAAARSGPPPNHLAAHWAKR